MFPVPMQYQGVARSILRYVEPTAIQHLPNSWTAIFHRAGKGIITLWAKGGHPITLDNLIGLGDELQRHLLAMAERHQIPVDWYRKLIRAIALIARRFAQERVKNRRWGARQ